jgi:hypothetical protein
MVEQVEIMVMKVLSRVAEVEVPVIEVAAVQIGAEGMGLMAWL